MENPTGTTPAQAITTSTGTTVITANPAHTLSTLNKFAAIMAALEPLILAGVSPFIKNANTQTIVVNEAPIAQNLFNILSQL